jgi:hypothetical protein
LANLSRRWHIVTIRALSERCGCRAVLETRVQLEKAQNLTGIHSNYNLLELTMKTFISLMSVRGLAASAAFVIGSGSALAVDLKVELTGAQETPPVTTSASGTGTIAVAADKSVSGTIKTKGIDGTVAHIHVGAPGQSGPPIITLDKGSNGVWSVPSGSKLTDEQYASYKAGNLYVNVHSAEHKPGEIRAQIKP